MNKISSYQRLKQKNNDLAKENKELKHDIKVMVMHPEIEEGIDTYFKWIKKYDKENN